MSREDIEYRRLSAAVHKAATRHRRLERAPEQLHYGTVTQTSPLRVQLDIDVQSGDDQPAGYCRAYAVQAVGDRVLCLDVRGEVLVIDAVDAAPVPDTGTADTALSAF